MALPKKMDPNLKVLVDFLQSPSLDTSDDGIGDLFEDRYSFIWKYIKLDETPDMVKFEAFLINVIYYINKYSKKEEKRKMAQKLDRNLLSFGLLEGYYHTKTDNYGIESCYDIKERCTDYLNNSDYIILEKPELKEISKKSIAWQNALNTASTNLEVSNRRSREYVTSIMTKWMAEKGGCQKYLQEGIDNFTITEDGELKIKLQEPSYTLDNFPLSDDSDMSKIDEQSQTKNSEIPFSNNEIEEFDTKEDNPAKITLPINEPKGNNVNRNTIDLKENKEPQRTEYKIGTNRTESEVKQESTAATMGDKPNKDSQLKLNLKIILLAIAFIALIIGFIVFGLKKHYAPPNESEENTVNNLEVSEENDNSETQVNGDIINYNIENIIVGDYIQSIPMDTSDSLSVGEYIDQSIVIEALEDVLSTSLMNQNAQLDHRPLYTQKEIDDDGLRYLTKDGKVTFNSIKDPNAEFYDEQYFVGVCVDDGDHDKDSVWSHDRITAKDGETYVVRAYVHNNAISSETNWKEDGRGVAHNVKTAFNIPQISDTKINVHGIISATNAVPQEICDNIVFESENDQKFHLEYVFGSALLENKGIGSSASNNGKSGRQISDDIVKAKSGGTLIGFDALDGELPGCYYFSSYVTIKVKVVYDSSDSYILNNVVRLVDDDNNTWTDNLTAAKIGDIVEYQIAYENTGTETQENVMILDKLPSNLEYISGTTKLWNAKHDGLVDKKDAIFSTGINIGNYAPGANAYIRLRAKIVDINLEQDSNTLTNWVKGSTNHIVLQDFANVIVFKSDEP